MDKLKKLRCSSHSHKSHLSKLLNSIDEILANSSKEILTDSNIASLQDYSKQLQQKATVFADIDGKIMDHLDNEDELKTMVFESEDLQATLSQKILLLSCQLTEPRDPVSLRTTLTTKDTSRLDTSMTVSRDPPSSSSLTMWSSDPPAQPIDEVTDATPTEVTSERGASNTDSQFAARLPKLDVPVFSGDSQGW